MTLAMRMDKQTEVAARGSGFPVEQEVSSLCPYGPVYRLAKDGRFYVLKRTGHPNSTASALKNWLHKLSDKEIEVVKPALEFEPNPRTIEGASGDWVVYPYIEGEPYRGLFEQIGAAGRLLGRIHSAGMELGGDLRRVERLPVHDDAWRLAEIGRP